MEDRLREDIAGTGDEVEVCRLLAREAGDGRPGVRRGKHRCPRGHGPQPRGPNTGGSRLLRLNAQGARSMSRVSVNTLSH